MQCVIVKKTKFLQEQEARGLIPVIGDIPLVDNLF